MIGRVLVTGGATGLGRGIARALIDQGHEVMIVGRRAELLQQTAEEIGARALPWNVTRDQQTLMRIAGPLEYLVNCAGHYVHSHVDDWKAEDFRELYEVHVVAPAMLARAFACNTMLPDGDRSIVNVASTLAERSAPGAAAYSAAKAGLVSLTRSLALELAPRGIRCNAVLPGVVPTDMTVASRDGADSDDQLRRLKELHPIGRLGEPQDVARAVMFLMEASWITGAALPVDGGLLVG